MNKIERIEKIKEAQELLYEAVNLIEEAIEGTNEESNVRAYIVSHLRIFINDDHGFLSSSLNLDNVIESLQKKE